MRARGVRAVGTIVEARAGMRTIARVWRHVILLGSLLLVACGDGSPANSGGSPDAAPAPDVEPPEPPGPPEVRSPLARDRSPDTRDAEVAALVAGNTGFAADLYRELVREPGNVVFAPHSIATALTMTLEGARGDTEAEMTSTLHVTLPKDRLHAARNRVALALEAGAIFDGQHVYRLKNVNALFAQKGKSFGAAFLDTLAVHYGAGVRVLDFAADLVGSVAVINEWVKAVTAGKIVDLLSADTMSADTQLVLVNAIYFASKWQHPFRAEDSAMRPFTTPTGVVDAKAMRTVDDLPYRSGSGFRAAALPFNSHAMDMVIVVPDDLATFEAGLDGARLADVLESFEYTELTLQLPVFRFQDPAPLRSVLEALGMRAAFTGAADLSGIKPLMRVADVVHQSLIAVDEEGAEAAAATAVVLEPISDRQPGRSAELIVDRPFLFAIVHRQTREILFLGRVVDPR